MNNLPESKKMPFTSAERSQFPVLVMEATSTGSLAVIRSLGKAGYPVHAASSDPDADGFYSTFTCRRCCHPGYASPKFLPWLENYVMAEGIAAIIPSESFLLAIRSCFDKFSRLLPIPSDEKLVYAGLSKVDTFAFLQHYGGGVSARLPDSIIVERDQTLPKLDVLAALSSPLFLKVDGCYSLANEGGFVVKAADAATALLELPSLLERFHKVIIQGYVSGQGCGVFFFVWDGEIRAEFQHRRLHEVPHTGGASSLRESWRHDQLLEDARLKIKALGWQGVAMLEYRGDDLSGYRLMELNSRFWGSLHLALVAGIDFPRLLLDLFLGAAPEPLPAWNDRVKSRLTWPGEAQYLMSVLRDRNLGVGRRFWACPEFILLSIDPRVHSDYFWPGDRRLFFRPLLRFLKDFQSGLLRRMKGK